MLSKLGFDIVFGDLEGVTACDILAEKEGLSCEVEAKSLPIFSGYPILPQDADKFFLEIRRHFRPTIDRNSIPVLNITLRGRLSPERGALLEMVAACNQAVEQKASSATATATIAFGGTIPDDAPAAELAAAARQDAMQNGIAVYVTKHQPKVMIRYCGRIVRRSYPGTSFQLYLKPPKGSSQARDPESSGCTSIT